MARRGREEHERLVEAARLVAVARLVPSVAHQLSTPLAAIALRAESLERAAEGLDESEASAKKVRRHLRAMREEAFRCKDILSTLQLFTQPPGPEDEWIDMGDLCRGAVRLVRHEAMRRQVEIVSRIPESEARVRGERIRLGQAVLALLVNAIAASPEGGVVTVQARAEGGRVVVSVDDQGPGVPPAIAQRLFEPFVSSLPPGSGTGLGLAACHSIAGAHGGSVSSESPAGGGTRFSLSLLVRPHPTS